MKDTGFDAFLADQAEEHVTGEPARRRSASIGRAIDRDDDRFDRDYRADFFDCSNTGLCGSL